MGRCGGLIVSGLNDPGLSAGVIVLCSWARHVFSQCLSLLESNLCHIGGMFPAPLASTSLYCHQRKVFVLSHLQVIAANQDRDTTALHFFSPPLVARYVRFLPQSWNNAICMRIELYGCFMGKNLAFSLQRVLFGY